MIGRIPRPPARGWVCDKCKQPAHVLYVQRGQLCGRCAYPDVYRSTAPEAPRQLALWGPA